MSVEFNNDTTIRISLPDSLNAVQNTINKFGIGSSLNSLENKLNETTETAALGIPAILLAIYLGTRPDISNLSFSKPTSQDNDE